MDPSIVDGRLPLRRFVLFFADDAGGEAQELFERLERLGFSGRLYNDAGLLALEADEYRRTELAVRNSQYWFVYATDSFFAERGGFLEQHCGELLAQTALVRSRRYASRLIPIYCKPKSQYRRLAWGFGSLTGLYCRDRHFEAAVTGLLKSDAAESLWRELEAQWQNAKLTLQEEEEEEERRLQLERQTKPAAASAAKAGNDGGVGMAAGVSVRSSATQCGRTRRPAVASNAHVPSTVIYNINVSAHQSTVQVGDSNATHYCAPSWLRSGEVTELSPLHPTSTFGVTMDGLSSITASEGFSNDEGDMNGDGEAAGASPVCNQAGTAAVLLLSSQPGDQPASVVDSSRLLLGSGSRQLPSFDALPAPGAVSDSVAGGCGDSGKENATAPAEAEDRSSTVTLHGPCTGMPNSEVLPSVGEARDIPVARVEPYRIVHSDRSQSAGDAGLRFEGSSSSPQQVSGTPSSTAVRSERVQHEGTAV